MGCFLLLKHVSLALTCMLLISSCGSGNSSSGASSDITLARDYASIFDNTTFHARCVNCHTFNEGNAVSVTHASQNRSNNCATCHIQEDWRASQISMTTTGRTGRDVCNTAVERRGSANEVAELLRTSPHVRWAIEDGSLPDGQTLQLAPPGNQAQWLQMIDEWVAAGASCG